MRREQNLIQSCCLNEASRRNNPHEDPHLSAAFQYFISQSETSICKGIVGVAWQKQFTVGLKCDFLQSGRQHKNHLRETAQPPF